MGDLPSGAGYVITAYAIAAVLYAGYWVRLRKSGKWEVGSGKQDLKSGN